MSSIFSFYVLTFVGAQSYIVPLLCMSSIFSFYVLSGAYEAPGTIYKCIMNVVFIILPTKGLLLAIHIYMMTESKIKETRYSITSRIQRNCIRCRYTAFIP